MKDKKYIIIIYILLFLVIIIILLSNYKNIELYENKNKLLISPWNATDFKIYNDNFDKFWYKKGIDYPIPSNDDATKCIKLYLHIFSSCISAAMQSVNDKGRVHVVKSQSSS